MPFTVLSGNPTGTFEEAQDSALKYGNPVIQNTPTPASLSGSQTATAQQLLNGIITVGGAAAATLTLPTASALAALMRTFSSRGVSVGDTIYPTIVNGTTGAGTAVTLAAGSGMTFDTNTAQTIPQNNERTLVLRFTNGTLGSEALQIF